MKKYELFQKTLECECKLITCKRDEKPQYIKQVAEYMDTLDGCGWRQEYDTWCQCLAE